MPQAKRTKQPTRAAKRPSRATAVTHARAQDEARRLDRITRTLEVAQEDLSSIGGSVGTGVRDLRRDVAKLLRDARRDLTKMRHAIERDLDRFQKDLSPAASSGTGRGRAGSKATSKRATSKASSRRAASKTGRTRGAKKATR
jgi:ABC-type transporter Mla subunit MlaD